MRNLAISLLAFAAIAPCAEFEATKYGAKGDGKTDDTAAI
jgi:polygalacturonase